MRTSHEYDFDSAALTWDENPGRVALARSVAEAILLSVPVRADVDCLDYGCGTGLVTIALAPHVRNIVAADSSKGMLSVLSEKLSAQGIVNVTTLKLDMETDPLPEDRFDLITTSMALHHIANPSRLIANFYQLIKPEGRLCIADLDAEDGSFHGKKIGVHHHGFDRNDLMRTLEKAGFVHVTASTAHVMTRPVNDGQDRDFPVFLIVGKKI